MIKGKVKHEEKQFKKIIIKRNKIYHTPERDPVQCEET